MIRQFFSDKTIVFLIAINILFSFFLFYKFYLSKPEISGFYLNYFYYSIITLIFLLFFAFFLNKNGKNIFKIVLFSSVFSIYAVEIYLQFYNKSKKPIEDLNFRKIQADKLGIKFDTRSKLEVLNDLLNSGKKVVPTMPPNDIFHKTSTYFKGKEDLIFPLANISNSKTVFCNESGKRIIYLSDRYGFRNQDKLWDSKKVDIVILGDSLVHGACVDDEFVINRLLSKLLNKKILNLGIQGHGPLMQLAALKEYALDKKPKVVLWYYSEANDLANLADEMAHYKYSNYIEDNFTQNLKDNQKKIDDQLNELWTVINEEYTKNRKESRLPSNSYTKKLIYIIKLQRVRDFITYFLPQNKALINYRYKPVDTLELYFKILINAKKLVEKSGGEIIFVYHPHLTRYLGTYAYQYGERQYTEILQRTKNLNIKTIDIKQNLFDRVENPKKLYHFGLPGHPNELGYKLTAEYFAEILEKTK